ncbi:hypothetical protein KC217_22010, partial [Mycobacterium tuberculosis]|nr:hypothetical protein [Mycobacterium tuberculosis]
AATVAGSPEGEGRVKALLGIEAIFGTDLPANAAFVTAVTTAYQALVAQGARATVAALAARLG